MLTFAYQARDPSGQTVTGVQDAIDEDNAVNTLMMRGLMVMSIQQKSITKKVKKPGGVSDTDLVLFTRQLATMIEAGLPLVTGLSALYDQCDPKRQANMRNIIGDVMARVQQGDSFSDAIRKHPRTFSRLYQSMVRAGETGGLLSEIMDRLASFLEATSRLKKKVKSAMTYPVIVVFIAIVITTFLIVRVVPVFGEIFADFGANLPAPTQFLLNISDFVRGQWWWILIIFGGTFYGLRTFVNTKSGREFWDRYKLKLPVFGPLVHKIAMTRFARTFAQLLRAGVPILEVMEIVGETSGNVIIEHSIQRVSGEVEKGDNLATAMGKEKIFPPMLLRMISAGESTGKIDQMLEKMADFWDEEVEAMLDALTSLIEPILICVLGVIVGGIVIAMFLPIFKLNEIVSK